MNYSYPPKSWIDPRLEKRPSLIHGTGVFASMPIRAGERLVIPGGTVFTTEDRERGRVQLDPKYRLEPCLRGTSLCRGRVTGDDWRLPELHRRYRGHFVPFLERRIEKASR